jgi:hypothetical protein
MNAQREHRTRARKNARLLKKEHEFLQEKEEVLRSILSRKARPSKNDLMAITAWSDMKEALTMLEVYELKKNTIFETNPLRHQAGLPLADYNKVLNQQFEAFKTYLLYRTHLLGFFPKDRQEYDPDHPEMIEFMFSS